MFQNVSKFENEHVILARLVPRCTDPCVEVRRLAIDGIHVTLKLASRLDGNDLPTLSSNVEDFPENLSLNFYGKKRLLISVLCM